MIRVTSNLLLVLISSIVAVFLVETTLFILKGSDYSGNRLAYVEKLRQINPNTTLAIYPTNFLFNDTDIRPIAGLPHRLSVLCEEDGKMGSFNSDRHGFNNPDEVWNIENRKQIVFIGDSFTQGACTYPGEDFVNFYRKSNPELNVINLGMGGSGPLIELAILKEISNLKKIDTVYWGFFEGNDFEELNREIHDSVYKKYLDDDSFLQEIFLKQDEVNELLNKKIKNSTEGLLNYLKKIPIIGLGNIRSLLDRYSYTFNKKEIEAIPEEFIRILSKVSSLTESQNFNVHFLYFPSYEKIKSNSPAKQKLKKEIQKEVQKLGFNFVDIENLIFRKSANFEKKFTSKLHYNAKTYSDIADIISR